MNRFLHEQNHNIFPDNCTGYFVTAPNNKPVKVDPYKRSTPSSPPYEGKGNKPGPKPVKVEGHKRSLPEKGGKK
jgi:hypothetical protein